MRTPGFIGAHVVDQALKGGFRVRLTARSTERAAGLVHYLKGKYPVSCSNIEVAIVEDFAAPGAFDKAVKDVQGIAHLASVKTFSPVWADVVDPTIKGTLELLESASKEASVKRVVYTSSSTASGNPNPNGALQTLSDKTWNDDGVHAARTNPTGRNVYAASKTLAERAAWHFMESRKPSFILNAVLPNTNIGAILPGTTSMSTGGWVYNLARGSVKDADVLPPQWFVDVSDTAKMHLICLTQANVQMERIWTVNAPFTWNMLIDVIRKVSPTSHPPEKEDTGNRAAVDRTEIVCKRAWELMKPHGGFRDLETAVRANLGLEGETRAGRASASL
ncbi:hypothetical protein CBS101457_002990 [Exobasidium rhododendri]|nr:hypothetical protein CBS101457_002990 [Exobasidium rhododendri]